MSLEISMKYQFKFKKKNRMYEIFWNKKLVEMIDFKDILSSFARTSDKYLLFFMSRGVTLGF